MSSVVKLSTRILQGTSKLFTARIVDEHNVGVPATALVNMTLTYYDRATQTILNGRSQQPVLNANDVTMGSDGLVQWAMQPADTAVLNARKRLEYHVALFTWTWVSTDNVTHTERHEVQLTIERVPRG